MSWAKYKLNKVHLYQGKKKKTNKLVKFPNSTEEVNKVQPVCMKLKVILILGTVFIDQYSHNVKLQPKLSLLNLAVPRAIPAGPQFPRPLLISSILKGGSNFWLKLIKSTC